MTLTNEELRIKVAEAMGWSNISHHKIHAGNAGLIGSHIAKDGIPSRDWVPNYPLDLNACAEFETTLTYEEAETYEDELCDICKRDNELEDNPAPWRFAVATAKPKQRCLAYLKTKGILP